MVEMSILAGSRSGSAAARPATGIVDSLRRRAMPFLRGAVWPQVNTEKVVGKTPTSGDSLRFNIG